MSTRWTCRQPVGVGSARCSGWIVPVVPLIASIGGCTYSGGELLYFLGAGRGQKVEAEFRLTDGPLLILIEDVSEHIDSPATTGYLFDDLAQELLKQKAARKIIPSETLAHLRQSLPDFEKRGCREIGESAGAHQVLWIEVQDFLATEQVEEVETAAYFSATVKVINALEKDSRSRVRAWPVSPQGRLVTVNLTSSEAGLAKSTDAIAKDLAKRLAVAIAKLFYDHRLGDFERRP